MTAMFQLLSTEGDKIQRDRHEEVLKGMQRINRQLRRIAEELSINFSDEED